MVTPKHGLVRASLTFTFPKASAFFKPPACFLPHRFSARPFDETEAPALGGEPQKGNPAEPSHTVEKKKRKRTGQGNPLT